MREYDDKEINRRIGRKLLAARLAMNMSRAELARRAGVDRTTVWQVENGAGLRVTTAVRLARAVERPIYYLLTHQKGKTKNGRIQDKTKSD